MTDVLCQELSRLIFTSIGAIPSITNNGLVHEALLRKERINVEVDGKKKKQNVWFGEILDGSGSCQAVLTKLDSEFTLIISNNDNCIGLRFDWDASDDGLYLVWAKDKWVPLGLSQKLSLAQVMNDVRDQGCLWEVPVNGAKSWPELYQRLLSLVEHDDEEVDTEDGSE
jgi:hypothetical protein